MVVLTRWSLLERLKRAIYAAADGAEIIAAVVVATDEMRKAWGVKIDEDPKPWSEALTLLENLYTVDDVHILAQCVAWTKTHVLVPIPQPSEITMWSPRYVAIPRKPGLVDQVADFGWLPSAKTESMEG